MRTGHLMCNESIMACSWWLFSSPWIYWKEKGWSQALCHHGGYQIGMEYTSTGFHFYPQTSGCTSTDVARVAALGGAAATSPTSKPPLQKRTQTIRLPLELCVRFGIVGWFDNLYLFDCCCVCLNNIFKFFPLLLQTLEICCRPSSSCHHSYYS